MSSRRAHPESYSISHPQYLRMTPDQLRQRWLEQPAGPQSVILFFNEQLIHSVTFSNWYQSSPFRFRIPSWANASWLAEQGLSLEVTATYGECPLMLVKATLMRDAASFRAILQASSPADVKALGRGVQGFDEQLWQSRVCATTISIVRARAVALPELANRIKEGAGQYFSEASPTDRLHGVGLAADNPAVMEPRRWRGANVLGWAYMTCAAELAGDARRSGKRKAVEVEDGEQAATSAPTGGSQALGSPSSSPIHLAKTDAMILSEQGQDSTPPLDEMTRDTIKFWNGVSAEQS